jgi:hypothetical protein
MTDRSPSADLFLQFLARIRKSGPSDEKDEDSIRSLAVFHHNRHEDRLTHYRENADDDRIEKAFLKKGFAGHAVPVFRDLQSGLRSCGYTGFPDESVDSVPGKRTIFPAIKRDHNVPIGSRQLAAVKVKPGDPSSSDYSNMIKEMWTEIDILRAVVHKNVIGYIDHFAVVDDRSTQIFLMMELATAGNLNDEISRFNGQMDEDFALYFIHQIGRGLKYLHSKYIIHNNLHAGHILLKYNRDGTKTCMICDFRESIVTNPHERDYHDVMNEARNDVFSLTRIVADMLGAIHDYPVSRKAQEVCDAYKHHEKYCYNSVDDLFKGYKWFQGQKVAPNWRTHQETSRHSRLRSVGHGIRHGISSFGRSVLNQISHHRRAGTPQEGIIEAEEAAEYDHPEDEGSESRTRSKSHYSRSHAAATSSRNSRHRSSDDRRADRTLTERRRQK